MDYENNVKRVIPMIMLVFISSATMISVINIISPQLTVDFGISPTTVSLLSMTVMLMMGVASVAYSTLSDYLSIRRLMLFGVCLMDVGAVMGFLAAGRSFYMLLAASALMITGGTCGSGLMIILVSRYIGDIMGSILPACPFHRHPVSCWEVFLQRTSGGGMRS